MLFCERFAGCAGTVANIPGGEEWKKVSDGGDDDDDDDDNREFTHVRRRRQYDG